MPLSDIPKILKSLVTLADDLQRYHAEMKDIRRDIRDLTLAVTIIKKDLEADKRVAEAREQSAKQEQENLLLQIENKLLKYERQLPPAKEGD